MNLPADQRRDEIQRRLASHSSLHSAAVRLVDQAASESFEEDIARFHRELFTDLEREDELLGTRIGHYEVESQIGYGGMGRVFLANDHRLNRKVAIKTLPPDREWPELRTRLLREARTLARLDHPGIVTLLDIVRQASSEFLVMEYVPGEDLTRVIERGPLDLLHFKNLSLQICDAVAATHEAGFVHRDLKPANIRIREDGQVKILDFGLARLVEGVEHQSLSSLTVPGQILGSPMYLSPEQSRGETMSRRSDVFALGVVLYEMATGKKPFAARSLDEYRESLEANDRPSARSHRPELPANIDWVIERCLRMQRANRFATGRQVFDALYKSFRSQCSRSRGRQFLIVGAAGLCLGYLASRKRSR